MKRCIGAISGIIIAGVIIWFGWMRQPVRYAVFAGYNADHKVPQYALDYIKGLNEVVDGVVYVTDSPLLPEEAEKVAPYVLYGIYDRHEEYDFGSYKRGYMWLKANGYLDRADELIFANDSTYAPLNSFKPMFKDMAEREELDFWGDSKNTLFANHLQSYFLVFRKKVIKSKSFEQFIQKIHHQPYPEMYITEYEIKLTPLLENLGYKWDCWLPYEELSFLNSTDKNSYPYTLISRYGHQFLKRRTFTEKLEIKESRTELLTYLKTNAPATYQNIMSDFPDTKRFLQKP